MGQFDDRPTCLRNKTKPPVPSLMYDAIIVGLGGMGSATLAHASQRGMRVLGLEQFARGHDQGASSGRSRIIRKAYFEHANYVPLLQRAYALWRTLEADTALDVLRLTGVLLAGLPDALALRNARASALLHGIPFEELSATDIVRRYPRLAPRDGEVGIFEADAGVVMPETAIEAYLRVAQAAGAALRFEAPVATWHCRSDGTFTVELVNGEHHQARRLAICMGPWFEAIAARSGIPLVVERRVQHWFAPDAPGYGIDGLPTFLVSRPDQPSMLYGFPDLGDGVKAAFHAVGEATTPGRLDRSVTGADIEPVRRALEAWIPGSTRRYLGGKVCMYALTPDEHFVLGLDPADSRIVIAGGFSGHGFKFAAVIGEIITDLLADGETAHDIGFLSPRRFLQPAQAV